MIQRYPAVLLVLALVLAGLTIWVLVRQRAAGPILLESAYATPLPRPERPLSVYHLGHSLVGRDMPAMLAQLAGRGHDYASQLGWGSSLMDHWEPTIEIQGFREENARPRFRAAYPAISSGDYDAVILTEMVELRDAIRWHNSSRYLHLWANLARVAREDTQVYLYETWHPLTDPDWLVRLDNDLDTLWERRLLGPDLVATKGRRPVHVIPAGQVLAAFVRKVEEAGGIDNIHDRTALFARDDKGDLDSIHLNDLGNYLVALVHYATLYHRSPVGLPHELLRADGTPATAPGPQAAQVMQETAWEIVTSYEKTGVAP